MFESSAVPDARSLLDTLATASREENMAAARQLRAIGDLFRMRRAESGETEDWAVDTWSAVGAEVAAARKISLGKAGSYLTYAVAMSRLPAVSEVFAAGDIDLEIFQTIVYRTELITDEATMTEVDRRIALRAARWSSLSRGRLTREIDRIIHAHDKDAVRRVRERARDRDLTIWDSVDGAADLSGRLFAADAHMLDKRLDALAATVCADDPRTASQRRADALGALAAGADRLMCRCEGQGCPAATSTAPSVVIHVVADQATLEGRADRLAYLMGADALISAEMLRDLAAQAKLRPLTHPADAPPENRYRPSVGLADFVRARDLTCRAPGCDKPATDCDIDHTVPYGDGGPTHASNCKSLCRVHHLLKTFWGWRDRQLPDGTVIWTLPGDRTYVTTPGSALLFPALMSPTGQLPTSPAPDARGERTAMMPMRKSTRADNRAHRIATERSHNRAARQARAAALAALLGTPPDPDDEPPPF